MAEAAAGARLDAAFNVRGDVTLAGAPDGTYTITINPSRMVRKFYRSLFRLGRKAQNTMWPFTPGMWALGCSGIIARVVTAPSGSWWRSGLLAQFLWRIDSAFPWQKRLPTNIRCPLAPAHWWWRVSWFPPCIDRGVLRGHSVCHSFHFG